MSVTLPKKILIGVDGSEPSLNATAYAARLAKALGSRAVALHVVSLPPSTSSRALQDLQKDLRVRGEGILAKARGAAAAEGVDLEGSIAETGGSVVKAIIDFAEATGTDLIVLGTRGTSGMPKLMLGSVAAGVVSFAHCPVLAVR